MTKRKVFMSDQPVSTLPKIKAFEVVLSNGYKLILHEPTGNDIGALIKALPSIATMQKAMEAGAQAEQGVMGMVVDLPSGALDGLYSLLAMMSNLEIAQIKSLPLWDVLALFGVLTQLIPTNPQSPQPVQLS
jgi:hypothetical protein